MKYLQRLGKSLMLPVSIMPIAALLKGIGYWIDPTGWGIHNPIAALLIAAGGAIIDNLPILFAIAVAMGMSKKRYINSVKCSCLLYDDDNNSII